MINEKFIKIYKWYIFNIYTQLFFANEFTKISLKNIRKLFIKTVLKFFLLVKYNYLKFDQSLFLKL